MTYHVTEIDVTFSEVDSFDVTFGSGESFSVDFGQYDGTIGDEYDGPYEVTPTEYEQTLSTQDKVLTQNVIVHPIPSNYGLITWNGTTITVS